MNETERLDLDISWVEKKYLLKRKKEKSISKVKKERNAITTKKQDKVTIKLFRKKKS